MWKSVCAACASAVLSLIATYNMTQALRVLSPAALIAALAR